MVHVFAWIEGEVVKMECEEVCKQLCSSEVAHLMMPFPFERGRLRVQSRSRIWERNPFRETRAFQRQKANMCLGRGNRDEVLVSLETDEMRHWPMSEEGL